MVKYILLTSAILLTSCLKDDKLSLVKEINNSNIFKLNGYYYSENFGVRTCYFFYQNGLILNDNYEIISFEEREELYSKESFTNKLRNDKTSWGIYLIDRSFIKFERWYPSDRPYQTAIREGEILNDTTFVITKSYRPNGSNLTERNEVYKFKSFSPKPDSTNMFIK